MSETIPWRAPYAGQPVSGTIRSDGQALTFDGIKGKIGGGGHAGVSGMIRRMKASNIGTVKAVSPWPGL